MRNIQPSQRAYAAVRKLARNAAKNDNWLQPELDGIDEGDPGDIGTAHRESWQQTCHWEHFYGRPTSTLADQQQRRFGELTFEERYFGLYEPLVDAFWDEWEETIGFWDVVNATAAA